MLLLSGSYYLYFTLVGTAILLEFNRAIPVETIGSGSAQVKNSGVGQLSFRKLLYSGNKFIDTKFAELGISVLMQKQVLGYNPLLTCSQQPPSGLICNVSDERQTDCASGSANYRKPMP
jgi:hypothetical protein